MIRVKPIDIVVPPMLGELIHDLQFFTGSIGLTSGLFVKAGRRIYLAENKADWWGLDATVKFYLPVNVLIEVTGPETT